MSSASATVAPTAERIVPQTTRLLNRIDDVQALCGRLLQETSPTAVTTTRDELYRSPYYGACIAVDLEGEDLCRNGSVGIVTIATKAAVYLVDIAVLGDQAFAEGGLGELMANSAVTKVFFDCRADCDALFHLYRVTVRGAADLQVACVAKLSPSFAFLPGMKKSFEKLQLFTEEDSQIKAAGVNFFDPAQGGSYAVWIQRPLDPLLVQYCAVDVKYFFKCMEKLGAVGHQKAMSVAKKRIARQEGLVTFTKEGMVNRDF